MTEIELEPLDPEAATQMLRVRAARRSSIMRFVLPLNSAREYMAIAASAVMLVGILASSLLLSPAAVAGYVVPVVLIGAFGTVVFSLQDSSQKWGNVVLILCGVNVVASAGIAWAAQHVHGENLAELQNENARLIQDDGAKAKDLAVTQQRLKETTAACETLIADADRHSAQLEQQLKTERGAAEKARSEAALATAKAGDSVKAAADLQQQLTSEKEARSKAVQAASDSADSKKSVSDDSEGTERQLQRAKIDLQNEKTAREKTEKDMRDLTDKLKSAQNGDKGFAQKTKDFENQLKQAHDQLAQAQKRISDLEQQLAKHHK